MSIIEPPPIPPKKETIAIRLELPVLDQLRRYAAFLGTRNLSHVITRSLEKVFKADTEYKAWLKAHPDFRLEHKTRRNGPTRPDHNATRSSGPAPRVVAATERRPGSDGVIGGA
jgi:hypothetical protein